MRGHDIYLEDERDPYLIERFPPNDGWAIRPRIYHPYTDEHCVGPWHRTRLWLRRNGLVTAVVTMCDRAYVEGDFQLAGDNIMEAWPEEMKCPECFPPEE